MNAPAPGAARVRRDLALLLLAGLVLLAWDASGLDLVLDRWAGGQGGFPWRDAWLTRSLLHDGGRALAWLMLALALVQAWWRPAPDGPARRERAVWSGVVLLSLLAVPALKRASLTSCPWDLAEFGGVARYVSHWQWGVADGGPGHCFPSGHAVAAFAFGGLYFLWRDHRPARARAWLAWTLGAGVLFGAAQWLRGAHHVSHALWTAWLCTAIAVAAQWALNQPARLIRRAEAPASPAAPCACAPRPCTDPAPPGRRGDGR